MSRRQVVNLLGRRGIPVLGRRWVLDLRHNEQRSAPPWGAGYCTVAGGEDNGRRVGVYAASPHHTLALAHLDW